MKTKVLVSCTVTPQLICIFVFTYSRIRFSHEAHIKVGFEGYSLHRCVSMMSVADVTSPQPHFLFIDHWYLNKTIDTENKG